ncbi:MAG: hypothetical protein ACYS0D_10175 [Planctomycetota bacterium]
MGVLSARPPARQTLRVCFVAAILLCAGMALSGCTVAGAVLGGAVGAAIGGPDGAVALGEAGLLIGAGIDAAIVGAMIEDDHHDHPPQVIYVEAPPPETTDTWRDQTDPAHRYEY